MIASASFLESRDFLLAKRADYEGARKGFVWPRMPDFNWALDYFDPMAAGNDDAGTVDRRGIGRRAPPVVRGACRSFQPGRELAACAGRAAR